MIQRYNAFNQLHKGLRTLMYETGIRLQQSDLPEPANPAILDEVEQVIDFFNGYAREENAFLRRCLAKRTADTRSLVQPDKDEAYELGVIVKHLVSEWRSDFPPAQSIGAWMDLQNIFHRFVSLALLYMIRKERQLNKVLWDLFTDEDIRTAELLFIQSLPAPIMTTAIKWMLRGISDHEIALFVTGIRIHGPAHLYAIVLSLGESGLEPARWSRIEKAMDLEHHRNSLYRAG
jgi:hypothetical protein